MAQAEAFELGTQHFLYKSWQMGHKEGHNSYICSSSLLQATEITFIFLYCRAQKYSTTPEKPRMPHSMRSGFTGDCCQWALGARNLALLPTTSTRKRRRVMEAGLSRNRRKKADLRVYVPNRCSRNKRQKRATKRAHHQKAWDALQTGIKTHW